MNIFEKLKQESLRLRKEKNPIATSIQFALSEIEKVGKNAGNRATTEDEAIRVIQKIIATIDENLTHADTERKVHLNYEKKILESVLPKMVTEEEVLAFLNFLKSKYSDDSAPKKNEIMKAARDKFGSLVDMKKAGLVADTIFAF
jgi:uncharacterized protein YqeY